MLSGVYTNRKACESHQVVILDVSFVEEVEELTPGRAELKDLLLVDISSRRLQVKRHLLDKRNKEKRFGSYLNKNVYFSPTN